MPWNLAKFAAEKRGPGDDCRGCSSMSSNYEQLLNGTLVSQSGQLQCVLANNTEQIIVNMYC